MRAGSDVPMHQGWALDRAAQRRQLLQIIERAAALERRARAARQQLAADDPERLCWMRIERRYATIRGNALHLLALHERRGWWHRTWRLLRRSYYLF